MKKFFTMLGVCLLANLSICGLAVADNQPKYQLSTHILDIAKGSPAANVEIELFKLSDQRGQPTWTSLKKARTNENGRVGDFLAQKDGVSTAGTYKLVFYTQPYFARNNRQSFYPYIEVVFQIADNSHYHVPITLSDFGYSTYRGS